MRFCLVILFYGLGFIGVWLVFVFLYWFCFTWIKVCYWFAFWISFVWSFVLICWIGFVWCVGLSVLTLITWMFWFYLWFVLLLFRAWLIFCFRIFVLLWGVLFCYFGLLGIRWLFWFWLVCFVVWCWLCLFVIEVGCLLFSFVMLLDCLIGDVLLGLAVEFCGFYLFFVLIWCFCLFILLVVYDLIVLWFWILYFF